MMYAYWIGEIPRILRLSTWVAYISNSPVMFDPE